MSLTARKTLILLRIEAIRQPPIFCLWKRKIDWLPTPSFLDEGGLKKLADFDAYGLHPAVRIKAPREC